MHLECDGRVPEADILLWEVAAQVLVDADAHAFGPGDDTVGTGHAEHEVDVLGKQIQQPQVVLHNHDRPIYSQALQYAGHIDALVDVQVGADLIEEVEVRVASSRGGNGHPLHLPSGQAGDLPVHEVGYGQPLHQVGEGSSLVGLL